MSAPEIQPQSHPEPPPPTSGPPPTISHEGPPTRLELELEFVTMLTSPAYLSWLALNKYFKKPEFVEYLHYLQYWASEPYVRYLTHPAPTLKVLQLLQQEDFRRDVLRPDLGQALAEELMETAAGMGRRDVKAT